MEIKPLVVVKDNFDGKYSQKIWYAFNCTPDELPFEIFTSELDNFVFWDNYTEEENGLIGLGDSPDDAIYNLSNKLSKLKEKELKANKSKIPGRRVSICKDLDDLKIFLT